MPPARKPPGFPTPYAQLTSGRATLRFYLGDCLDILRALRPGSVSAIVTSPPYNLGVRYRTYHDALPRGAI
jgi:site-specific DNA-methyltransferase (adenine-specific)